MKTVSKTCGDESLRIQTLGSFEVRRGSDIITGASSRSYRLWDLFKLILTNRDKPVFTENIIDQLLADKDSADPQNALKNQVYRLRKMLGQDKDPSRQFLLFANNCYKWNTDADYWLDTEHFSEAKLMADQALEEGRIEEATQLYTEALSYYKGPYLGESTFSEWLISARNYFHRMYTESVSRLIEIFSSQGRHEEIVALCEKALAIEFYEESWHRAYIDALQNLGKTHLACAHFDNVSTIFMRELGVALPAELRPVANSAANSARNRSHLFPRDERSAESRLYSTGAFVCSPSTFRKMYVLEMRRNDRNGQSLYLGMIRIDRQESDAHGEILWDERQRQAEGIITRSLRGGDIVTHWQDGQFLVLLPSLNMEQAELVMLRLHRQLDQHRISISYEILPIQALAPELGLGVNCEQTA